VDSRGFRLFVQRPKGKKQILLGVTKNVAKFLVESEPSAIQVCVGYADSRLFECRPEPFFTFPNFFTGHGTPSLKECQQCVRISLGQLSKGL
jgi:hypothetical protein